VTNISYIKLIFQGSKVLHFFNIFLSFHKLFKFQFFQLICTSQPKYNMQHVTAEKEEAFKDAHGAWGMKQNWKLVL